MSSFRVSVIIPVYNAAIYVSSAVESALQQKETGEVLLIEDGSTDNSFAVCQHLAKTYETVKLLRHENGRNHGAAASRNLGIHNASCPFIAFLDADDFYLPNRFANTSTVFAIEASADGVYEAIGTVFTDYSSKELWDQLPLKALTTVTKRVDPEDLFEKLITDNIGYFSFDGFTCRRGLFSKVGYFNETLLMSEDTELMIKLSALARLYPGSIEKPIAMRRIHALNRITHHLKAKRKSHDSRMKVMDALLSWGAENFDNRKNEMLQRLYISHLRKVDYFDDFRWSDYVNSRVRMVKIARRTPSLLLEPYFWRRVSPARGIFFGRKKSASN